MLDKTRGIVLHLIRYSDSGIIVYLYTREFGRQTILLKGMRNKKSGRHNVFFQPMFILDMEMYFRQGRSMQSIKEFSVGYAPVNIQADVKKSTVAMFLGEFLYGVLKEEDSNPDLFDFIAGSVIYFDKKKTGFANFHIAFLSALSSFLGFEPTPLNNAGGCYFDLKNGRFVSMPPEHGEYADRKISEKLAAFFASSFDETDKISLSGSMRNEILETLLKFYQIHLPGLRNFRSLEILKEVFR